MKRYMYNGGLVAKKRIIESIGVQQFNEFTKRAEQAIKKTGRNYYGEMVKCISLDANLYLEMRV